MTLAHDVAGHGDPPLVLVHGWCCDRSFLAPQLAHFRDRHRVLAVDLPGHGGSADARETTIEGCANAVAGLAAGLGFEPAVVVGHSMGALVALALARDHPARVRAVVMLDPPPLEPAAAGGLVHHLLPLLEGADGTAERRRFVEGMFLPTDDAARRARIVDTMAAVPGDVAVPMLAAMGAFDAPGALAATATTAPVLIIGSAVPSNASVFLRRIRPTIRVGQTVGAGHFHQLEVPDQVNAMIERFLVVTGA